MELKERENYTKLLEIDHNWLLEYLADMITENDDDFELAIETKDRDLVQSIIEKHIY